MTPLISYSEQDTISIASRLASYLHQGDIVVLSGDLGSGKTKFTQGILRYFGIEKEISSPTFTIVNEYPSPTLMIYHFDVYRLSSSDEFYAIGGEQYFENGICLIEWGEMIQDALPSEYLQIAFMRHKTEENARCLQFIPHGNRYITMVKELLNHENTKY